MPISPTPFDTSVIDNIMMNGVNGHIPREPSLPGLSLTEYSASLSLSSEDHRHRIRQIVPDGYVLPNGNPDVCISLEHYSRPIFIFNPIFSSLGIKSWLTSSSVHPPYYDQPRL